MRAPQWSSCNLKRGLNLPKQEIHIWRSALDPPDSIFASLKKTLSPEELSKASAYIFERDRKRFIAARGILRSILENYTNIDAPALKFRYGARGKPFLANASDIQFNLSRSADFALYAVARRANVGIDLEKIRPLAEMDEIAMTFFSVEESEPLRALPPALREDKFFRLWTRKEAREKMSGAGLSSAPKNPSSAEGFGFSFIPQTGYAAAVYSSKPNLNPVFFQWDEKIAPFT